MRKALKILLPLVLVLVLLVSAYWFFFQFRTDITAGICASIADRRMDEGKYDKAITWYQRANKLDGANEEIALKLAGAYLKTGNYTKTEYVLVNAIYECPDCTELYVELSRVYVAQDKLMDAQIMLDQVRSETAAQALAQMRPAAPAVSPEGGYYSDYIDVTVTPADDAACYLSTGGDYPSIRRDLYTEPVKLGAGETAVCAVAVSENGLVSPVVYAGYTVAGVVEDAVFADDTLKHYVQEMLNRSGRTLRTDDLWAITELSVPEGVASLDDLHYFSGLTSLKLADTLGTDFSFLSYMPSLRELDLSGCAMTTEQLTAVCTCRNLEVLRLSGCGLSNLTPLADMAALRELDLSDNSINNLTPLAFCTALESLDLEQNALTTLSSLSSLTGLKKLNVARNTLKSIAPISGCALMEELNVSHNELSDVTAVGSMPELQVFDASANKVEDVSALSACTKLRLFTMQDNKLTSIDFMDGFREIREIDIDYNDVLAVPAFDPECELVVFKAAHNFLEDLSGLAVCKHLNYVKADYNNIRDIDVLKDCPSLTQVDVFGTYITEGGELEEMGVIVNYTPNVYN